MARIPLEPAFEARRVYFNIIEDFFNPVEILPPLYMQHNPNSWTQTFKKKIHRYQTIAAQVEEHWGDELDTITASAVTGSFYLETEGLTTVNRSLTQPFFKFQDILDIYRNNGNTYDEIGRVIKKGNILISYDEGTYLGYFESFNYLEDANVPFTFSFDFIFKVERSYVSI
jgi:hypothetical protein